MLNARPIRRLVDDHIDNRVMELTRHAAAQVTIAEDKRLDAILGGQLAQQIAVHLFSRICDAAEGAATTECNMLLTEVNEESIIKPILYPLHCTMQDETSTDITTALRLAVQSVGEQLVDGLTNEIEWDMNDTCLSYFS